MLTTRCPDCQTTFRVTSVALHKAAGQVRCGQCSGVFSAFDSLTDTQTQIPVDDLLLSTMTEVEIKTPQKDTPDAESAAPETLAVDTQAESPQVAKPAAQPADAAPADAAAEQIPWHPAERAVEPESPRWRIFALAAAAALLLQGIHHFRNALAVAPVIGSAVSAVYSGIGVPIVEAVDPENFAIVNWVATAQDASLAISTGVRNTSDTALPYPMLSLELTDRWEETIGARVFTPDEYMSTRLSRNARIRPSTTVTAQLQLVDPGPDAYGFEVDICVAVSATQMRCKKTSNPFQ